MKPVITMLAAGAFAAFSLIIFIRSLLCLVKRPPLEEKLRRAFERLDYSGESIHIIHGVISSLQKKMGVTGVNILTDNGNGYLETVYCTEEDRSSHIRLQTAVFSRFTAQNGAIILKRQVTAALSPGILTRENAAVLLVLHNKGDIFALILLGEKKRRRSYSPQDIRTLKNLYPHFYVFAWYLKHIAFQPLAGLVSREIHFSEETIQTIQGDVDQIGFPGVDGALYMSSVKKLHGNYADFVRLSGTRYLVALGDFEKSGLGVCMSMAILKTMVRLFVSQNADLRFLAGRVNDFITRSLPEDTAFAGVFMLFDFASGVMQYANCGISSLLIYNEDIDRITRLPVEGTRLGSRCEPEKIPVYRITLQNGITVLAGTGEIHGDESVRRCLLSREASARNILRRLYDTYALTGHEVQTDSCAVLVKITDGRNKPAAAAQKDKITENGEMNCDEAVF